MAKYLQTSELKVTGMFYAHFYSFYGLYIFMV